MCDVTPIPMRSSARGAVYLVEWHGRMGLSRDRLTQLAGRLVGHICAGTGPTPATSAPGLGSPWPHRRRDWAHPGHIGAGTCSFLCIRLHRARLPEHRLMSLFEPTPAAAGPAYSSLGLMRGTRHRVAALVVLVDKQAECICGLRCVLEVDGFLLEGPLHGGCILLPLIPDAFVHVPPRPPRPLRWGIMLRGLLARIVGVCA